MEIMDDRMENLAGGEGAAEVWKKAINEQMTKATGADGLKAMPGEKAAE